MKKNLFSIYIIIFLLLQGCVSANGNKKIANSELHTKIQRNVTTKAEIAELFGEPTEKEFTEENTEIWEYTYSRADLRKTSFVPFLNLFVGGVDTKSYSITVKFNKNDIVKAYAIGKSNGGGGGVQDMNR